MHGENLKPTCYLFSENLKGWQLVWQSWFSLFILIIGTGKYVLFIFLVIYNKAINKNMISRGFGKIYDLLNRPVNDNHHIQAYNWNKFKHKKLGGNFDLFL